MNSANPVDKTRPVFVHQSELLWRPAPCARSRLQTCCFCLSDWLIYLIATLSLVLGGIIFIALTLGRLPLHYLRRQLSLHLPATAVLPKH